MFDKICFVGGCCLIAFALVMGLLTLCLPVGGIPLGIRYGMGILTGKVVWMAVAAVGLAGWWVQHRIRTAILARRLTKLLIAQAE